jgi:hypothetical protein
VNSKNIERLNEIIESGKYNIYKEEIKALIKSPENINYFLNKIPESIDNLDDISFLFENDSFLQNTVKLLEIFNKSISGKNNDLIIEFCNRNYFKLETERFGKKANSIDQEKLLEIIKKIIKNFSNKVDKIFNLVNFILSKRKNIYNNFELNRNFLEERDLIANLLKEIFLIYKDKKNNKSIEKIIKIINKYFNIVEEEGEFVFLTPDDIFNILKEYIDINFNLNFFKIVNIVIKQYISFKNSFNGWEPAGSGISREGFYFYINDKHYVIKVFQPAIERFYLENINKGAWNYIKNKIIVINQNNISEVYPDFLNRSCIPILLKEYSEGKNKEEAFEILKSFISSKKGIPNKSNIIFQILRKPENYDIKINNNDKLNLIKEYVFFSREYNIPASNIFVNQIVSSLATTGNKESIEYLLEFFNDEKYIEQIKYEPSVYVSIISNLLSSKNSFNKGSEIFRKILNTKLFINEIRDFDIYDFSRIISKILVENVEIGLKILNEIYKTKELSTNQQILIFSGIENISEAKEINEDKAVILVNVYNNFLKPILTKLNNISSIENRFTCREARESIIKFAEKLAIIRKYDESLFIINKFLNDSDPPRDGSNYPDDPDGTFNYHQKIINGDSYMGITTVRGWIPWVLQKFINYSGRDYIPKILPTVEELLNDDNYYVRVQACIPLIELVKIRHNVMPKNNEERFLDFKIAQEIERISFKSLEYEENQRLSMFMEHLSLVFSYMRSLDEKQAMHMFKIFIGLKDTLHFKQETEENTKVSAYEKIINKISSTLVFYAEFRKDIFNDERYKYIYKDNWNSLKSFNVKPFKQLLINLLKNSSSGIRSGFAWQFYDAVKQFEVNFEVAFKYIKILVKNFDHDVFRNIYIFIESNINNKFEECYYLWTNCLISEREYIKSNIKDIDKASVYWWPYFYNGKILNLILDKKGINEFLEWFEFLLDYPKDILIANDLEIAVEKIIDFPKDNLRVKRIFNKLIERNPKYFDFKSRWKGSRR